MQSNNPFYQLLFFDLHSKTLLSHIPFPSQPLRHYPDPNLQIQNLPNLESRFPIKNSNDFTVEVFENNGEKKKYTLEELAKIVPDDFFECLLERKIENGKLKIISDKAIDESYSNKILIRTGVDSFAVIPKYLIEKAREEEKKLRREQEKRDELDSFSNPTPWGGDPKSYQEVYSTVSQSIDGNQTIESSREKPYSTVRRDIDDSKNTSQNADSIIYGRVKIPIIINDATSLTAQKLADQPEKKTPDL
jgi:hypothetical protein